jgi:hypothetical protein
MRAASSRICFTIANNHQTAHPNHPDHPIDHPPADNSQPISETRKVSIHATDPVLQSVTRARYRSPLGSPLKRTLVDGYTQLVSDRVRDGWACHLVTVLFSQLPGPRAAVINRMKDEVQRVYSALLTRVHRKPRTAPTDELPVLVGALDLPVYKRDRSSAPIVLCNGGLHFHALVLLPPSSRLKGSLVDHFREMRDLYVRPERPVQRIHVEPVVHDPGQVVDYVFKTVRKRRLVYDDVVLVLPRARSELEDDWCAGLTR